jgi:hypothetical protein
MDIREWLELGVVNGFCTEAVCQTHDGATLTDAEQDEFEAGDDPCVPIVRLWPDRDAVPRSKPADGPG